jgi:hypothetical protein
MRKPVIRRSSPSETSIHLTVAGYLRRAWPAHLPWWHTPNGEKRTQKTRTKADGSVVTYSPEGGKLKAMGALAGVPDLIFIMPDKQIAFIELKKPKGGKGLSDDQIKFRDRVQAIGCAYVVCRSVEDVEATITRWLRVYDLVPTATILRRAA